MAGLDPRFGPAPDTISVSREYLAELYAKADRLRRLEERLAALVAELPPARVGSEPSGAG